MNVEIKVIPHGEHRPEAGDTVGDWWFSDLNTDNATLHIRISEIRDSENKALEGNRDPYYEMLVAHHELTEALLCWTHGISTEDVDRFDRDFSGDGEPGDSKEAPYYEEHQIATGFERILANQMIIFWQDYERAIEEVLENAVEKRKQ